MSKEIECKTHPDAPHGFLRNASHTEDRYVCECEYWEKPEVNKRIKELAEQAGLKWKIQPPHYTNTNNPIDFPVSANRDLEKFAELIVRECADLFVDQKYMILNPHEPFANERVRALKEHDKDTVKKIKQHFGVEE